MRDIVDLPFNALSYRVKVLEDRIATQANQITAMAHQSLQDRINIRAFEQKLQEREKYFKTLSEKLACKQAQAVIQDVTPDLVIPKHLKKSCGVGSGKMAKSYEIIKKRYALWKLQYESGFSLTQIARAWKCDHGSVGHAKRNNFIPKKSMGRMREKFLSINKNKRIRHD
jgi:uncharacterized coiled-coil protein SlyX